jgi:hypothetical protein
MDGLAPTPWRRRSSLPTVAGYFALVWSQIAIIAATTALGGLIGVVLAVRLPPAFQASASIELPATPTWVSLEPLPKPPQHTTIDSTAQLLFSAPVVERVSAVTHLSHATVTDGLSVSAYPLSNVLIASFRAPTAALAVSGVDEAARALVQERTTALQGSQLRAATQLSTYLSHLLPQADRQAGGIYNPVSKRLQGEIDQITDVRQAAVSDQARVLKAGSPATSVRTHGGLQIATGAMLGFLVGLGYAWWIPVRRRSGWLGAGDGESNRSSTSPAKRSTLPSTRASSASRSTRP